MAGLGCGDGVVDMVAGWGVDGRLRSVTELVPVICGWRAPKVD